MPAKNALRTQYQTLLCHGGSFVVFGKDQGMYKSVEINVLSDKSPSFSWYVSHSVGWS